MLLNFITSNQHHQRRSYTKKKQKLIFKRALLNQINRLEEEREMYSQQIHIKASRNKEGRSFSLFESTSRKTALEFFMCVFFKVTRDESPLKREF